MADLKPIAIFGDIHANLPALDAVLSDMESLGLDDRYCLGDLVGYGTEPNAVISRIRELAIPTLMGNYDQGVGNSSDDCGCAYRTDEDKARGKKSIAWTNEQTYPDNKQYLRELPQEISFALGEYSVMLVHGSPRRVNEYLFEDRPDRSFERLLDDTGVDVLICGHTHIPYHKVLPSGRHVINAGSVGKPKDGNPRACYLVLSSVESELDARFVRVPYDVERAARGIEQSEMPDAFAEMLRQGSG
ncbi:MAG: metallophosphoesterase family protein [Anaerolineales bacterium]